MAGNQVAADNKVSGAPMKLSETLENVSHPSHCELFLPAARGRECTSCSEADEAVITVTKIDAHLLHDETL